MGAARMPEKVTKKFKVVGKHKVAGVAKGGEVSLTMTPGTMAILVAAGSIEEVQPEPVKVLAPPVKVEKKGPANG